VIIKVERSGGILGSSKSIEIDVKDLPPTLIRLANKILMEKKSSSLPKKATPVGAADHFFYRVSIQDGANNKLIECNEYDVRHDLKQLIKYMEKTSKKEK